LQKAIVMPDFTVIILSYTYATGYRLVECGSVAPTTTYSLLWHWRWILV